MKTIEELLKEAINENLCRTEVSEVEDHGSYNLYELELNNNNITTGELAAISEVVGDDDLQVEARGVRIGDNRRRYDRGNTKQIRRIRIIWAV